MSENVDNLIGKTLGTCIPETLIGQGGMGKVYLARQIRPLRYVAIKVLLPNITTDSPLYKEFLARFRREADVIARLEQINIMPIYEYGEQDSIAYLVMPHLSGGSLRDLLARNGALSLQEAITFIDQAAAALDYAHTNGVIHRDLKPGNFLLHTDGRLVLADFGIARIIQESDNTFKSTLTSTGMLLGTPEYMAPEMFNGEPIDYRADLYALGIVLFQVLSGQIPFKGNTPFAVATKHLHEPPPLLHQIRPTIPSAVDTVIQKALSKKREDRYTSAGAMAQALRNASTITDYPSETQMRNAPTVISPPRLMPPSLTIPIHEMPPPVHQTVNAIRGPSELARPRSEPSSRGFSSNGFSQPVTPYHTSVNRLQPWLIFIGILLVLILVIGGVLVGLQINKSAIGSVSTGNTTTSHSSNLTAGTQTTPTSATILGSTATSGSQQAVVPKGSLLYLATSPGHPCDSNGGNWANYNQPTIVCQASGTEIVNPNPRSSSPDLVGMLLTSIPNKVFPTNYVIEVQLQQIGTTQADFGIYFRNQLGNQEGVYTFFINSNDSWSSYVYNNSTGAPSLLKAGTFTGPLEAVVVDVAVIGSNFSFYLNNHLIGRANDGTYSIGTVGIAVDAGGTIVASNFVLYSSAT